MGSRQRSIFITQAAEKELMRRRQLQALNQLVPWNENDHPELKQGFVIIDTINNSLKRVNLWRQLNFHARPPGFPELHVCRVIG